MTERISCEKCSPFESRYECHCKCRERIKSLEAQLDSYKRLTAEKEKDRDAWKQMAERLAEALRGIILKCDRAHTDSIELNGWLRNATEIAKEALAAYTAKRGEGEEK